MADDRDLGQRVLDALDTGGLPPDPGDAADAASALEVTRLREIALGHRPDPEGGTPRRCTVDGDEWPCAELRAAAADAGITDA